MQESDFWKIIESSGSPKTITPDEQCENIIEQLTDRTKDDLISFANTPRNIEQIIYMVNA